MYDLQLAYGTSGQGRSVWLGPVYMDSYYDDLRSGPADQLLEQAVAWAAGWQTTDCHVVVQAGDALTIQTYTPGDGAGEPASDLDPLLMLYGPDGTLVA